MAAFLLPRLLRRILNFDVGAYPGEGCQQMTSPWRIQTIVTTTGERLTVLIDRDTGVPLFNPTVYELTEVPARNRAANTIEQHLVAIECLLPLCSASDIDLDERFQTGHLLTIGELEI